MTKERLLIFLVAILVILNLILIGSFWMKEKPHHPRGDKGADLQEMFDFSNQEMADFEVLKKAHRSTIRILRDQLSEASQSYFRMEDNSQVTRDSILTEIQKINREIYEANYSHFQDIKIMITEDKYPALENLIKRLLPKEGPTGRKKRGRRN